MLIFNNEKNRFVIDPMYLSIIPLKKLYNSERNNDYGEAKLLWLYHFYNPHSPFRDYPNNKKSEAIISSVFPKAFIELKQKHLQQKIDEAILKNKELNIISDIEVTDEGELKPKKKPGIYIPTLKIYDPLEEEEFVEPIKWYKNHLQVTALWAAYESYKEAIYNLSKIIADPQSSASSISTASKELDTLPIKMERMRQQAIKDEANTVKIGGDKNIRRGEKLENYKSRQAIKNRI